MNPIRPMITGSKEETAVFKPPVLEQDTVESLSQKLLQVTAKLSAANTSLEKLQQERSEMLANLSHDLRAPLTAIRSAVDYLLLTPDLTKQDLTDALALLDRRTATLEHLIREMQELFLLEDTSRSFSFQELDALSFLEEYFYTALPDQRYASHVLQLNIPQDLSCTISIDPEKMVRVLDNLLTNAAKFAPAGTKITLGADLNTELSSLSITVTDQGCGIPAEDLERIFTRTYTVQAARTPGSPTGSGLGLAIVRAIVTGHGGTVTCESKIGAGSTFRIKLPILRLSSH